MKKQKQYYYKVVRITSLGYRSAYYLSSGEVFFTEDKLKKADPKWLLPYEIEEKTTPIIGKIFAFLSLDDAKDFLSDINLDGTQATILKGTGRKSSLQLKVKAFGMLAESFWKSKGKEHVSDWKLPTGTVLLDYFVPIEMLIRA